MKIVLKNQISILIREEDFVEVKVEEEKVEYLRSNGSWAIIHLPQAKAPPKAHQQVPTCAQTKQPARLAAAEVKKQEEPRKRDQRIFLRSDQRKKEQEHGPAPSADQREPSRDKSAKKEKRNTAGEVQKQEEPGKRDQKSSWQLPHHEKTQQNVPTLASDQREPPRDRQVKDCSTNQNGRGGFWQNKKKSQSRSKKRAKPREEPKEVKKEELPAALQRERPKTPKEEQDQGSENKKEEKEETKNENFPLSPDSQQFEMTGETVPTQKMRWDLEQKSLEAEIQKLQDLDFEIQAYRAKYANEESSNQKLTQNQTK